MERGKREMEEGREKRGEVKVAKRGRGREERERWGIYTCLLTFLRAWTSIASNAPSFWKENV